MHEELKRAIARILQAAKDNEKGSGIYCTSGDQAREFADQGFQMVGKRAKSSASDTDPLFQVSVAADMIALPAYLTSALASAKGSYAHSALNMAKGAASGLAKITGPYGR